MKKYLILLFILISFVIYSQSNIISEVVEVDSKLTKNNLFSNALSWFAVVFNSANNVIQMKDIDSGKIIGKGIYDNRNMTVTITCKDGKYKYEIGIEPKTDIIIPITFKIDKWLYLKGVTTGKLKWINGEPEITDIIFTPTPGQYGVGDWIGYYGIKDLSYSQKWTDAVDKEKIEIINKYKDMDNPNNEANAVIIKKLTDNLKEYMIKTDDF